MHFTVVVYIVFTHTVFYSPAIAIKARLWDHNGPQPLTTRLIQ